MKLPNKNCQRTKEKSIKILSSGPIYNGPIAATDLEVFPKIHSPLSLYNLKSFLFINLQNLF